MRIRYVILLLVVLALGACATTPQDAAKTRAFNPYPVVNVPMAYVSVGCVGHEGVSYIHSFYVQEPFSQRRGGLIVGELLRRVTCFRSNGGLV